jgi:AraC family transcriptional regulator
MRSKEILVVDMTKPAESIQLVSRAPILSSQHSGWKGLLFMHFHHPAQELPEHSMPHHLISISHSPMQQESRVNGRYSSHDRDRGDIGIAPAHEATWTRWDRSVEFSILAICPEFVKQVATEFSNADRVELISQVAIADPLIYQICLSLKAEVESGYPTGRIFGESAATMLAARLLQQHSVRTPKLASDENGLSSYTLRQVLDYIRSHLSQDLSITDLAQVAGMSPYYFLRLFKKSMQFTPRQYIIQMRIDRAKELLRSIVLSIADIALQCGFTNQSHFTNVFRQIAKTTPKIYQRDFG